MSKQKRDRARRRRLQRRVTGILCGLLIAAMLGLAGYAAGWYVKRARIESNARRYAQMYEPTEAQTHEIPSTPMRITGMPAVTSTLQPTAEMTAIPTPTATTTPTAMPTSTAIPTPIATTTPTATRTPPETMAPNPVAVDEPRPTANADTLVLSLPTPPPVQASFEKLLQYNPDTVGFLKIEGEIELPVVWRENDNDYYLDHNFDGDLSDEGALFLDGFNRLTPEDDCLIVYGHNMKNDTMFALLRLYGDEDYARKHDRVQFNTIYQDREYIPFAAFSASVQAGEDSYFDVRRFIFDEASFEQFVLELKSRSLWPSALEVGYGDHLLLLVTCDHTEADGRFILALRAVGDG